MVGTIASFHNTVAVVITMAATLAITFAIIAFSAQVRRPRSAVFVSFVYWYKICIFVYRKYFYFLKLKKSVKPE